MSPLRALALVGALSLVAVGIAPTAGADPLLTVTPDTGLAGGQTVDVLVTGLGAPGEVGGWCQGVSGPPGSLDYCAPGTGRDAVLDDEGAFGGPTRLERFIYVPAVARWIDCATTTTDICTIGAAVADRYTSGQGAAIAFDPPPAPPATRGTIEISPAEVAPDGQVSVTGSGFRPGALIDVFACEPGTGAPDHPSACALAGTSVHADGSGAFVSDLVVPGAITPPGGSTTDCETSGPCRVVAAEAVDFPGTAVAAEVTVATPEPSITVTPDTGLVGGQTVDVLVSHLGPPGAIGGWCVGLAGPVAYDYCATGTPQVETIAADGSFGGPTRLPRFVYSPREDRWVDCTAPGAGCTIGAVVVNYGDRALHPLNFDPAPAPPATRGTVELSPTEAVPGETVSVTGSGFRPGAEVEVFPCEPGTGAPDHPSACSLAVASTQADGSGAFSIEITADRFVTPPGGPSTDCLTAGPCRVVAAEAVDFPGTAAAAPLTILEPPTPPPTVVPGVVHHPEGGAGASEAFVPVALSHPSNQTVTVAWNTMYATTGPAGQAEAGVDYLTASGTVTFDPGETTASVPVPVVGDALDEVDEYVVVTFHDPTDAVMGGFWGLGFVEILDDDPVPTVLPGTVAVVEGDAGTVTAELPVTLSAPSARTVTVPWRTLFAVGAPAGQADPADDYLPTSGTVTFAPGETTGSVTLTLNGDTTVEADEYLVVSFHDPTNARMGGFWGLGFAGITNDD